MANVVPQKISVDRGDDDDCDHGDNENDQEARVVVMISESLLRKRSLS